MSTFNESYMDEAMLTALGGMALALVGVAVVFGLLVLVANWRIFTKAGESGWKILIPFYNMYVEFSLFWNATMFWVTLALSILGGVLNSMSNTTAGLISVVLNLAVFVIYYILLQVKIAKSFGHGVGFAIGLIFLQPIFKLILAFNSSSYQGPDL